MSSLLGCVVSVAGANLGFLFHSLDLELDVAKLSVARFVGWVITETVLRADVSGHACKRSTRIFQRRRSKTPSAGDAREFVHLAPGKVVELTADRHAFKRTHATEVVEVLSLCGGHKDAALTFELVLREGKVAR